LKNQRHIGEFELIDKLSSLLPINDKDVIVGFGDDTACVNVNGKLLLLTGDIQVENVHFIKSKISPKDLGWKLISSNVSDVVACGGTPRWGLISIALPKNVDYQYVENVYKGIKEALDFYKMFIVGGNTSSSSEMVFDLFLVGETDKFIARSSAKENQAVYISGHLGLSRAGLELLLMDKRVYENWELELIEAHTKPKARIDLQELIKDYAKSCIDISDGLAGDLGHISEMSNVKIIIEKEKLKIHPNLRKFCEKYDKNPYSYVLYGGEDYQLAFTIEKENEENLKNFSDIYKIGYTEEGKGVYLKDGKELFHLKEKGFEHL
jgi:thiamine-monophosphate kinase